MPTVDYDSTPDGAKYNAAAVVVEIRADASFGERGDTL